MLQLKIEQTEMFDSVNSKIIRVPEMDIRLEHSLLSISKWETIWEIPFQSRTTRKTREQLLSYIEIMELDGKTGFAHRMTEEQFTKVNEYLNAKHSATWFSEDRAPVNSSQTVTSELIYYWMTTFNIPMECENWPFNRLTNLIKIAIIKQEEQTKKKSQRSRGTMLSERAALNAKRMSERGTTG